MERWKYGQRSCRQGNWERGMMRWDEWKRGEEYDKRDANALWQEKNCMFLARCWCWDVSKHLKIQHSLSIIVVLSVTCPGAFQLWSCSRYGQKQGNFLIISMNYEIVFRNGILIVTAKLCSRACPLSCTSRVRWRARTTVLSNSIICYKTINKRQNKIEQDSKRKDIIKGESGRTIVRWSDVERWANTFGLAYIAIRNLSRKMQVKQQAP